MLDWMLDNKLTPHMIVKANDPGVFVPKRFVEDGKIVLNINPSAIRDFMLSFNSVSFKANFSGEKFNIYVPLAAVEGLYASENQQGIFLDAVDSSPPPVLQPGEEDIPFKTGLSPQQRSPGKQKPFLRVVRTDDQEKNTDNNSDST